MQKIGFSGLLLGAVILMQALLFFILPFEGTRTFLSPDETAVAVSARRFADRWTMRLEDPLVARLPWIHPRSFVTQGAGIVPVGFLGLPAFLGLWVKLLGQWPLRVWSPLLALSVLFPLWRFLRPLNRWSRFAALMTWMSFPTVILYANRGLFPNLTVVCLMIWAVWLLWEKRRMWKWVLAGFAAGLALSVRPIEAVWILPWMVSAVFLGEGGWKSVRAKEIIGGVFGGILPIGLSLFAAWSTYSSAFAVGYFLRDTAPVSPSASPAVVQQTVSWPFGFHPRRMWINVQEYLIGIFGPWFAVSALAVLARFRRRSAIPIIMLGMWTMSVVILLYGQAQYIDHVNANAATVGNSFLRYLFPVVPFFVLGVAAVVESIVRSPRIRYPALSVAICVALLMWLGNWTAIRRDDEGLLANQTELMRYDRIREEAINQISPNAIVFSERSDKIFFPIFRVASPIPARDRILELVQGVDRDVDVMLFDTTQSAEGESTWNAAGLQLIPVFQSKNQTLYRLYAPSETTTP